MDLVLLWEVTAQNLYRNPTKWTELTINVNKAIQQIRPTTPEIMQRTLKEHVVTLLSHHAKDNSAQLNKQVDEKFFFMGVLCNFMEMKCTF